MLAHTLRLAYLVLPLVASLASSAVLVRLEMVQRLPVLSRWLLVLGVATIVLAATHRAMARLLPLAALLEVSIAFPGEAPSRYAVARDAGNTAKLRELVERAQRGDPVIALDHAQAAREILALVAALRAHDSRTRGHSERVRVFTDLIAEQMELDASARERLRWAALLHDVGKLQVPASVLNKPGKLNSGEWDVIRLHPDAGARLTAPLQEWLGDWARTIPDHHEKYDGTGYPRGLAGEDISLGGRILAVADSFEVMTAARSYKKPMSREDALRELRRCAQAHFDPQVVRAMLAVSAPRLRLAMGPLAWIASTPFALAAPAAASTVVMQGGAAVLSISTVAAVAPLTATPVGHPKPASTSHTASESVKHPLPVVGKHGTTTHAATRGSTPSTVAAHSAPHPGGPPVPKQAKPAKPKGKKSDLNRGEQPGQQAQDQQNSYIEMTTRGDGGGGGGAKVAKHGKKAKVSKPSHHHDPHLS